MKFITIAKNSGFIQSGVSIIGNFLATGLSAIAIIIISRLLGPERFGVFSVGFAIVLILTRINELGLNTGIVKFASSADSNQEKNDIYSITLKYKLIVSSIIFTLGLIFSAQIASLINFHDVGVIRLAFTFGLITTYYEQLLFILQSLHRFNNAVIVNAIQAASKLVSAGLILFFNASQTWIVFLTYIASPGIPILFSKLLLPSWLKVNLHVNNSETTKRLFSLAKHTSVALISAGIIENIDVLFLQKYLSTYEAGLYGGISRIAMMFSLAAYSLGNVLNPRVARYKRKSDLSAFIKKAFALTGMAIIGYLIFIPFADLLINFTIGPEYVSGRKLLLILGAASFSAIASIPFIATFYSYDSNWYFSVSGILQLVIVLVGNLLFVPIYGLEAAAWTRVAARLSLLLFSSISAILIFKNKYEKV